MRSIASLLRGFQTTGDLSQITGKEFELAELQMLIDRADQQYYREGHQTVLSDEQYDALKAALRKQNPNDARLARVGIPYSAEELRTKVVHKIPMGSLDNTKDGIVGYRDWYEKTCRALKIAETSIFASLKVDGSSIRLKYEKGRLVEAVTRGNGEVGENITVNVAHFKNVPIVLPEAVDIDVRGEAILYIKDYQDIRSRNLGMPFDQIPEKDRSNPRNIGNGILGRDDGTDSDKMRFLAFNAYNGQDFPTEKAKFDHLKELGFEVIPNVVRTTPDELEQFYSKIADERFGLPFEIDGIVVVVNDLAQQRSFITEDAKSWLRPKFARAIKFPHKSNKTTLLSVDLTVGHTGAIVPTAVLKETRIGGVNVTHALLNNWDEINRLGVAIDDTVEVVLAGDIIPKIIRVVEPGSNRSPIAEPKRCPVCGEPTTRNKRGKTGAVTYCSNQKCPETNLRKIEHWIGTAKKGVGILGIGDTILRAMWDEQLIQDAADLYTLTVDQLKDLQLSGGGVVGKSRADKIVKAIQGKKQLPLHVFLGSLGIELLGRRRVQILAKAANGELDDLSDWLDDSKLESIEVDGFGDMIREAVRDGIDENRELINKLIANGVSVESTTKQPTTTSNLPFAGMTFCLTGTRDCQDEIVAMGGELTSGVAKSKPSPDYLVQKDPLSNSKKTQNAMANGHTQIISIDHLKQVIAGQATLSEAETKPENVDSLVAELTK